MLSPNTPIDNPAAAAAAPDGAAVGASWTEESVGRARLRRIGTAAHTGEGRAYWQIALYAALWMALLAPLLFVTVPPLVDYPNHLARMWILVQRGSIAELGRNYILHWRILPD